MTHNQINTVHNKNISIDVGVELALTAILFVVY